MLCSRGKPSVGLGHLTFLQERTEKMKKTLVLLAIVAGMLSVVADSGNGSIYYVPTSTTIVDGDTFCGGGACTSADTIIIRGGARGDLLFRDFNGNGSYITITNENKSPDSRVVITNDGSAGWGVLSLSNCKYVDLRGNNDGDITYGIKVINTLGRPGGVWPYGESDHIKISYIEIAFDNATAGSGIHIGDASLSSSWIFDTFEIHHNYIHGTGYAGMYLGMNYPLDNDNPYIANFSVHDNIMEDLGSYGMTLKGVHETSGVCLIYNNVIKRTGLVYTATVGEKRNGIKTHYYYGSTYANVYGNWIEATKGAGLVIGDGDHQVHNNILVNCGTENNSAYGHGIRVDEHATSDIDDNIIIQPTRYGVYHAWGTGSVNVDRNLIGDPGIGCVENDPILVEGTGANANICHADVASFGFNVWSDDGDYSNDDFTIGGTGTAHILTEAMGETVTMNDFTPTLVAGDTVVISPSRTSAITLSNIIGSPGSWITFTNPSDAQITIADASSAIGQMRISGCRYIRLLGNNYSSETYGIRLNGVWIGGCLGVVNTKDIEIAYIEAYNASHVGIGMSQCWAPWACVDTEIMENVTIHHNYIHDVGGEGMYLGKSSRTNAPKFRDVQIYNNRIENCGWDGIQLGQTIGENNNIYNNTLKNIGHGGTNIHCWSTGVHQTAPCPGQWFGIVTNPENYGVNIYRNYVQDVHFTAISTHFDSDGPVDIYDNVVWNAGYRGISVQSGIGLSTVINNTVVSSVRGISTRNGDTTGEVRYNLVIANSSGGISSDYSTQNDNRTQSSIATENFVNAATGDFRLTTTSPAKDAGIGTGYSTVDFDGNTRPHDSAPDIGAYEYYNPGELADLNNDGEVNLEDFAVLASYWMNEDVCSPPDWCGGVDFDMSGTIDLLDLATFVESWLWQ